VKRRTGQDYTTVSRDQRALHHTRGAADTARQPRPSPPTRPTPCLLPQDPKETRRRRNTRASTTVVQLSAWLRTCIASLTDELLARHLYQRRQWVGPPSHGQGMMHHGEPFRTRILCRHLPPHILFIQTLCILFNGYLGACRTGCDMPQTRTVAIILSAKRTTPIAVASEAS
jgi:hypothetical protein